MREARERGALGEGGKGTSLGEELREARREARGWRERAVRAEGRLGGLPVGEGEV